MKYISALADGQPLAALVDGDQAIPLRGITELGAGTPSSLLADPPLDRSRAVALDALTLRSVIPNPAKVICVGLNYRAHIEETGRTDSDYPVLFTKFATSLIGAHDDIIRPAESDRVDYEAELAVVIGTAARRVSIADALDYVAGYTAANDISMRDYQNKTHQWLPGKAWDGSTPLGPMLVTPDELPPWESIRMTLTLNGTLMQDTTTDLMVFPVAEVISTVSQFCTLLPGDVILTGTPGGVGMRQNPPVWLRDGDLVEVDITSVGTLVNRIRDER